jgi:hypothetical protein
MKKAIAWIISFTKVGKAVEPVQKFISGKGSYLSGAALMVPALIVMLQKFGEQGLSYAMGIATTDEFKAFAAGLAIIRLRTAITKASDPAKDPNYHP